MTEFLAWIDQYPMWVVELAILVWMGLMFGLIHLMVGKEGV